MAAERTIVLAEEFSDTPGGRYNSDGPFSGERFRDEMLVPAIRQNDHVVVVLDDTDGYGSSFLEEAFGGLYRTEALHGVEISKKLELVAKSSAYARYKRLAEKYMSAAREKLMNAG